MPYSPEHKPRTHAHIVETASRLFRRDGYGATGIDRLMSAAGLTRGGFYAHFRDKARLFSEALEFAFSEANEMLLRRGLERRAGAAWVEAAAQRYLSMRHRDLPEEGCAVPALGAEVARAPSSVRRVFGKRTAELVDALAERAGIDRAGAIVLLATWIGALTLARGVPDRAFAEEILAAARDASARTAGVPAVAPPPSDR